LTLLAIGVIVEFFLIIGTALGSYKDALIIILNLRLALVGAWSQRTSLVAFSRSLGPARCHQCRPAAPLPERRPGPSRPAAGTVRSTTVTLRGY
jgi:hypothetical protein